MRGYFNGRDRISATARSQTLEQIFKTVLTVAIVELIVILYGTNVTIMAAGANLATTLSVLLSFGYLGMYYKLNKKSMKKLDTSEVRIKSEPIGTIVKRILFVSFPITLSAIMSTLNKNVDSMTVIRFLKKFMTESQAKIQYGILSGKVDTLITLPLSFNVAFSTALVPAVSAAIARKDKNNARSRIGFSMLLSMIIGLPCTFGMAVFAQPILNLIFPNATSGALLLQISSFTIIFSVLAQTANGALQGLGKIAVPALSRSNRNSRKNNIKYNLTTNSRSRSKWSCNRFRPKQYSNILNKLQSTKKSNKTRPKTSEIYYKATYSHRNNEHNIIYTIYTSRRNSSSKNCNNNIITICSCNILCISNSTKNIFKRRNGNDTLWN